MAKCSDCGLDLTKFGPRHRCTTKIVGQRKATRLEAEQIAKGQLDASSLLPKVGSTLSQPGRLAKRAPTEQPKPDQTARPSRESQPSNSDLMVAISRLTAAFEALRSALMDKPRTDA